MWIRRLSPFLVATVLASACGETPADVTIGAGQGAENDAGAPSVSTTLSPADEQEPGTRPSNDAHLLLTAEDLPDWEFSGPTEFAAEPTFESNDCELMNEAWTAHEQSGTQVGADIKGVTLRQAAVVMSDAEAAGAVLDAADTVWEMCASLRFGGGEWWSEPVSVPSPDGWRAAGLALGTDDSSVWIIGYWQRGSSVVIVDLEGDDVWTHLQPVFAATAGRLGGEPTPATTPNTPNNPSPIEPDSSVPELQAPTTVPLPPVSAPSPVPDDSTFPPSGQDWTTHSLAGLAPDPDDLGDGWAFDNGSLTEPAPSEPDDAIEGCDVVPPPTLDGFELEYVSTPTGERTLAERSIGIAIGSGDVADAQAVIDAFRGVAACDLSDEGMPVGFDLVEFEVAGADDAVLIRAAADDEADLLFAYGFARFDEIVIGVSYAFFYGFETDRDERFLAPDAIADLMERIAAAR